MGFNTHIRKHPLKCAHRLDAVEAEAKGSLEPVWAITQSQNKTKKQPKSL
jgi:hypothetical protein